MQGLPQRGLLSKRAAGVEIENIDPSGVVGRHPVVAAVFKQGNARNRNISKIKLAGLQSGGNGVVIGDKLGVHPCGSRGSLSVAFVSHQLAVALVVHALQNVWPRADDALLILLRAFRVEDIHPGVG
ncbi:hypothetical protein SDC9_72989 [bioreactor metagenome]|uniref:Uncharacterized protein n=1 Tax=bioreactor metagenome TaxID=1076179 RepID=A0A644YD55_9ZZZZ